MKVSLVIPVRNEEETLPELFASIRAQTRQPDEVILVDGASTDGTVELVQRLSEGDLRFRILQPGPATPGRGRNVGIEAARCEWIALTDAGIRLEPDWLERLVEAAEAHPEAGIVYGNFEPVVNSWFEACETLIFVHPRAERPGGRMRGPFIASSLVRRESWARVGGFPDLRAAEDLIFMERLEQGGIPAAWAPAATVHWKLPPSPAALFRRFSLFSRHNVWAGRQRQWHFGMARFYALCIPFFLAAVVWNVLWLVPAAGLWLLRVVKSIQARSDGRGAAWVLQPARVLGAAWVLGIVELATWIGWLQAGLQARPAPVKGSTPGVVGR